MNSNYRNSSYFLIIFSAVTQTAMFKQNDTLKVLHFRYTLPQMIDCCSGCLFQYKNNNNFSLAFQVLLLIKPPLRIGMMLLESLKRVYLAILSSSAQWVSQEEKKKIGIKDIPGPVSLPIFGALWLYSCFGPYTRQQRCKDFCTCNLQI